MEKFVFYYIVDIDCNVSRFVSSSSNIVYKIPYFTDILQEAMFFTKKKYANIFKDAMFLNYSKFEVRSFVCYV